MKKKILLVCGQEVIKERNDGGKLCSYRNWEVFQDAFGSENSYFLMFSKYEDSSEEPYIMRAPSHKNKLQKAMNVLTGHMFTSVKQEEKVITLIKTLGIDIVIFERSMFGSLIRKIKKETSCDVWLFIHNIEKKYFENKLRHRGPLYLLPYLCVKKSERESLALADYIITLTERDSRLLKEDYQVTGNLIMPMTFQDRFEPERKRIQMGEKQLLFIGTMFPPNYDGIKWFVEQVMPELKDYTLKIVGKNFEQKKELERSNVQVIGTVDDLSEYYYADSVMIMPIFYGDGMKIKTAESMMYGRTIFASDEALEGYCVEGVNGIYRCNTKEEYIREIRAFFERKEGISYFHPEVRQLFLDRYSLDNQKEYCKKEWGL